MASNICKCTITFLMVQCVKERDIASMLGVASQGQMEVLHSSIGFVPVSVHTDPQSAFRTLTTQFEM
jgi:hypothetical protein